jgi:hypothetical protein
MRNLMICLIFLFSLFLVTGPSLATSWHYDFNAGEDLSALTVVNPTGLPSSSLDGTLNMHMPSRSGGGYNGFDLASWVNLDALRMFRTGGGEPFILETKLSTSSLGSTYLSGLFLYHSSDGINANDIIFGASPTNIKVEAGYPTNHTGTFSWLNISPFTELYLQVVYDGTNTTFKYKKSAADSWSSKGTISGYTFDYVGVITKTWSPSYGAASPVVDANFDYLYYNYTPAPPAVPLPPSALLLGSGLLGLAGWRRFRKG